MINGAVLCLASCRSRSVRGPNLLPRHDHHWSTVFPELPKRTLNDVTSRDSCWSPVSDDLSLPPQDEGRYPLRSLLLSCCCGHCLQCHIDESSSLSTFDKQLKSNSVHSSVHFIKMPSSHEILSTTTVTAAGGLLHRVQHASTSTGTNMIFAIFLPASYTIGTSQGPLPAICK